MGISLSPGALAIHAINGVIWRHSRDEWESFDHPPGNRSF